MEDQVFVHAAGAEVVGDFVVGVGVDEGGGAAEVAEEGDVGEAEFDFVAQEAGGGEGDAAALRDAGDGEAGGVDVGMLRGGLDGADGVGEDAAVEVGVGGLDAFGEEAGGGGA